MEFRSENMNDIKHVDINQIYLNNTITNGFSTDSGQLCKGLLTKVAVAFICDSHYVIPTAVAITSLVFNKKPDTYYDIYIISAGLSEKETEKFHEFRGINTDIHIIKVSLKKFKGVNIFMHLTSAAYVKFDLPELIPNQDKVLYLDSDVIIQQDLSDLFETNIDDYYAGAVKDIGLIDNIHNIKNYFNSGVMLLNLKLMRENNTSMTLLNIAKSADNFIYMDQDCLNILFENKVKLLPGIYNCFYSLFLKNTEKYTLDYINQCFGTNYSSLNNIKINSCIIHLVSYDKPWIYYDCYFVNEWYEYFKKSPFKLHKLKRKSKKIREFIITHNLTDLSFAFFIYWRNNGFKFVMGKVKKRLFNDKKNDQIAHRK
jgi:lipopolysaccharide biosynthesis glycosyltransferase